ncbi:helix-turn-helix transcriptional regulator [bacterium]|nr:helix-turn-helix transcriptional regulator [bacterium]
MNNNKKGKSFNIESICELMQNDDFRQIYEEERLVSEFTQALSDLMEEQDMNRAELAQILECSKSYISQLLNGNKNISLRNVAKVLYKLGKRMSIEVLDWENDLNLIG